MTGFFACALLNALNQEPMTTLSRRAKKEEEDHLGRFRYGTKKNMAPQQHSSVPGVEVPRGVLRAPSKAFLATRVMIRHRHCPQADTAAK